MNPMIISLAAFLGATMLIVGIAALSGMFNSSKAEDRLAVMTGRKKELESEGIVKEELFREGRAGMAGVLNGLLKRLEGMRRLFQQADCPIRPETRQCARRWVLSGWLSRTRRSPCFRQEPYSAARFP
jgi:hypothetical protein